MRPGVCHSSPRLDGRCGMHVAEVMTRDVSCCTADDSLSVAARMMWECDCGSVPVLESPSGRAIGMITDRDVCMATLLQDRAPSAISVREAMSHGLHSCTPEDSIARAEGLLRDHQIRRLPVLDESGQVI